MRNCLSFYYGSYSWQPCFYLSSPLFLPCRNRNSYCFATYSRDHSSSEISIYPSPGDLLWNLSLIELKDCYSWDSAVCCLQQNNPNWLLASTEAAWLHWLPLLSQGRSYRYWNLQISWMLVLTKILLLLFAQNTYELASFEASSLQLGQVVELMAQRFQVALAIMTFGHLQELWVISDFCLQQ